ncbi:ABC transporter permease [Patescibacteria group bacterium]|jgi:putative ABC transport system permease protein|nr:ABC transporter permease [Patescibacteria group bacterium]
MKIRDLVTISMGSLVRNKARAILTMLGIVIGIASVILMLSVGKAAENFLLSQVASFGSDVINIAPGSGEVKSGAPNPQTKQTLTLKDYRELKRQPWVEAVNANVISAGPVTYGAETMNANIYGSTEGEIEVFSTSIVREGRFLLSDDVDGRTKVAVLGDKVAHELFGDASPVGKQIKIKRQNFRVIGVMEKGGTRFFTKLDEIVYIPLTAAMDLYNKERLNYLAMIPRDISPNQAKEEVRYLFRDLHDLDNPNGDLAKDDFRVLTQDDAQQNAGTIGQVLSILLGSIAAISLVVGGIGIMNIMYVTVTERTSEIGLRKALGAKQGDVLGQFLAEAIAVTSVGGVVGIIFGVILSWLTIQILNSFQPGWSFMVSVDAVVLAFGVSAAIGIVFGFNPARRASRLSPIEALRYE